MKTIYNDLLERLKQLIADEKLRWIDWDKGQLKGKDAMGRYPITFPCALIRIAIDKTSDITDHIQQCKSSLSVTLAFDTLGLARTASNAPEEVRDKGLEPYDIIANVYAALQGFETDNFNPLSRRSQGELTHQDLFVYQIIFNCEFEDQTADG